MDTIGKFKTNFLEKSKSFNIGFNNRSPFDYKSSMPTNFISIPTISASPGDYALSGKSNYASFNTGGAEFTRSLGQIAKTIKDKSDRKKQGKKYQENIENLPDVYEKWKKNNPAGDAERFKEEHYDLVNDYMKQNRHMGFTIEKT